jgi:uncharacterized membrane protein SpoIIM required for sporulation
LAEPLNAFVTRRRGDWEKLSQLLTRQRSGALPLAQLQLLDALYRRATTDLAYAQSFFPSTDAHRFLNQLCASAYGTIYQPPRQYWAALREFYAKGFPAAVRTERKFIASSALIFMLGLLLGALVVLLQPGGAELLVPEQMRRFIAEKRMWTDDILSIAPPNLVASAIATNNLTVTIFAFASGILAGTGTIFILVNNGIQIGALAALCAREQMAMSLFSFIGGHGPLELSIIVIAGGAGLMVGQAVIDPGELPRRQYLKKRGIEAVKLVLGCAPFLVFTGAIEGFVSPGDFFPGSLKIGLGLLLGALFWGYLFRTGRGDGATRPLSGAGQL